MLRIRQGCVVVLALGVLVVAGAGAGCKKDDKAAAPGADKAAQAVAGAIGGASGDDLSLLPKDSEVVLGINVGQIQHSGLWKQFVEPKLGQSQYQKKLSEVQARCGFDPLGSVKSVSVGAKSLGPSKGSAVAVVHGLDKAKTLDCAEKSKDDIAKEGGTLTRDGDVILVEDAGKSEHTAVTFVNDTTAIILFGEGATAAAVKAAAAGGSGLKDSAAFLDLYKKVKTGDSLWFLASGKVMEQLPFSATASYGSLNVTDGFALDVNMRFQTPDAATQFANLVNGQAKQAGPFVDKAEFAAAGNEVHGSVVISSAKLQALLQQFGGMLGMLMGGMGGGQ